MTNGKDSGGGLLTPELVVDVVLVTKDEIKVPRFSFVDERQQIDGVDENDFEVKSANEQKRPQKRFESQPHRQSTLQTEEIKAILQSGKFIPADSRKLNGHHRFHVIAPRFKIELREIFRFFPSSSSACA
jgi:hypothetical protein